MHCAGQNASVRQYMYCAAFYTCLQIQKNSIFAQGRDTQYIHIGIGGGYAPTSSTR